MLGGISQNTSARGRASGPSLLLVTLHWSGRQSYLCSTGAWQALSGSSKNRCGLPRQGGPQQTHSWPRALVTYCGDEPVEWLPSLCVLDCDGAEVIAEPDGGDNAARVAVGDVLL